MFHFLVGMKTSCNVFSLSVKLTHSSPLLHNVSHMSSFYVLRAYCHYSGINRLYITLRVASTCFWPFFLQVERVYCTNNEFFVFSPVAEWSHWFLEEARKMTTIKKVYSESLVCRYVTNSTRNFTFRVQKVVKDFRRNPCWT